VEFYDQLETRSAPERHAALVAALREQVAHARALAPAYARILAEVDPEAVADLSALALIPVTRRSRLLALQRDLPPFGGLVPTPLDQVARVFQSPGPLYEPEGRQPDYWRFARALHAAGVRRGDLIHNAFSHHFTPAGAMLEGGAAALGCPLFPAGPGQSELQVRAIGDLRPRVYVGTPSFLAILIDKAVEIGRDISSLGRALVSGEAIAPGLRERLVSRGIELYQAYASADLGLIAYESSAHEGLICDEGVYVEIVRPGTDQPVPDGEVGEVVVTSLNPLYPLIRFGTGDLSAVLPGVSPCGRSNRRIRGWLGRADQSTKVCGLFLHPEQVAAVLARHPALLRARLEVSRRGDQDLLTLRCEVAENEDGLAERVAGTLRDICMLPGEVLLLPAGSLANDGKVVDDQRSQE